MPNCVYPWLTKKFSLLPRKTWHSYVWYTSILALRWATGSIKPAINSCAIFTYQLREVRRSDAIEKINATDLHSLDQIKSFHMYITWPLVFNIHYQFTTFLKPQYSCRHTETLIMKAGAGQTWYSASLKSRTLTHVSLLVHSETVRRSTRASKQLDVNQVALCQQPLINNNWFV